MIELIQDIGNVFQTKELCFSMQFLENIQHIEGRGYKNKAKRLLDSNTEYRNIFLYIFIYDIFFPSPL